MSRLQLCRGAPEEAPFDQRLLGDKLKVDRSLYQVSTRNWAVIFLASVTAKHRPSFTLGSSLSFSTSMRA